MNRRDFIRQAGTVTGLGILSPTLLTCRRKKNAESGLKESLFSNPLVFPEEISSNEFELVAETARRKLTGAGTSDVYTLNGSLPSPTIRVKRGETLAIDYQNRIDQESILHWHGLTVPPEMDGHPKDAVHPGQTYNYRFDINQRAGTNWYHPHPDKLTGPQVYRGLAGFLFVEDEEEQALNLPSGEYELPLLIQEKRLNDQGQSVYSLNMMDRMMGFFGNTLLVNGVQAPYHEVRTRFYRLRLLNGSNARIMELALSNQNSFYIIGSDGGLLDRPYETSSITLSPGERADLLVDFSGYETGDTVRLKARYLNGMGNMMEGMMNRNGDGMMNDRENMMERRLDMMGNTSDSSNEGRDFLEFRVTREEKDLFRLPERLAKLSFPDGADADHTRRIHLTMEMMRGSAINGRFFEMQRVDEKIRQGALETWEFNNSTMMPHPMHIHATQFKVLDRSKGSLAPHERGWKDTVIVGAGETVRILAAFNAPKGIFMFHCHNLEHEDNGMMANFEIV